MKSSVKKSVKEPAAQVAEPVQVGPMHGPQHGGPQPTDLLCDAEEDFNPEETGHLDALSRRAQWLEQRMATMDPNRGGARYDVQEYAALMWVFEEFGALYTPSPYYATICGGVQANEEPPIRDVRSFPQSSPPPRMRPDVWQPGRRPVAPYAAPIAAPKSFPRRFFPGGQV
jgi:hypothetical protein